MEVDTVIAGTGLSLPILDDPDAEIEARQELKLIYNVTRVLGSSATLGLEIGARYHLTSHGTYGFALLGSPTIRDAIEFALRYLELSAAFTRFHLEECDGMARVICDDSDVPEEVRFFLLNRDAAALRNIRNEIIDIDPVIHRMCVRAHRPPDAETMCRFWGADIEFGAEYNMSVFDATFLNCQLPQANTHAVRWCEAQCGQLAERRRSALGLRGRLRETVLRSLPEILDMETAASLLGMTSRTLRRRLADEGTTFRRLVDETRLSIAEDLLHAGSLSITEIAYRVGYADPSSFFHAFKRLTGKTPTQTLS